METGSFQRMLSSLQQTFNSRLPNGLTQEANARLQRTLKHYIGEVGKAQGPEQEVLRETFDSMANWFRRNTDHLKPISSNPTSPESTILSPAVLSMLQQTDEYDDNPLETFERIKMARSPIVQVQQKDVLQRQEDIVKYREVEYNLILNSKDRDWVNGKSENRYKFSVLLDSAIRMQGTGRQPTITNRFRNITRIEFIKAILPVEGLDTQGVANTTTTTVQVNSIINNGIRITLPSTGTASTSGVTADPNTPDNFFVSVLASPYITVIMEEMTANNFGTNPEIDKSLAVCQYDATWRSDACTSGLTSNRGYTLFIPKFMKAQRIYSPTPLANLQKMSFSLLNPENQLLSSIPDAVDISACLFSSVAAASTSAFYNTANNYIFLKTTTWFPLWAFSTEDRIQLAGLKGPDSELRAWLEQEKGHVVLGIAYDAMGVITDNYNSVGYSNYIIIQNRFVDPSMGSTARNPFPSEAPMYGNPVTAGSLLNVSRQVQLSLRIITRELDSTTNLRPDNI